MDKPKSRIIPWLGVIVESLYTSLPILSILNFVSIVTMLYTSTIIKYAPWLSFWMFIAILGMTVICVMLVVWKFVIPSLWAYRSSQMKELTDGMKVLTEDAKAKDKMIAELIKKIDRMSNNNSVRKIND